LVSLGREGKGKGDEGSDNSMRKMRRGSILKYDKKAMCDRILRENILHGKSLGIPKDQIIALLQTGNFKRVEKEIREIIDEVYNEPCSETTTAKA
jgi:hypothetical protein